MAYLSRTSWPQTPAARESTVSQSSKMGFGRPFFWFLFLLLLLFNGKTLNDVGGVWHQGVDSAVGQCLAYKPTTVRGEALNKLSGKFAFSLI